MTTCGVCKQQVDLTVGPHIHDPKVCRVCQRSLPATSFPRWPSSADGRRHQCRDCLEGQRSAPPTPVEKHARNESDKAERNQRLRARGYHWVIQAPDGRILTIQQAEIELEGIEDEERKEYWDEVPPGADL